MSGEMEEEEKAVMTRAYGGARSRAGVRAVHRRDVQYQADRDVVARQSHRRPQAGVAHALEVFGWHKPLIRLVCSTVLWMVPRGVVARLEVRRDGAERVRTHELQQHLPSVIALRYSQWPEHCTNVCI